MSERVISFIEADNFEAEAGDGVTIEETMFATRFDVDKQPVEYVRGYSVLFEGELRATVTYTPGMVVQYASEVEKSEHTYVEMQKVKSSNVIAAGYLPEERRMFVEFKGGSVYAYDNVLLNSFVEFLEAESVGRYLNKHIKGAHPVTNLSKEEHSYKFEYRLQEPKEDAIPTDKPIMDGKDTRTQVEDTDPDFEDF